MMYNSMTQKYRRPRTGSVRRRGVSRGIRPPGPVHRARALASSDTAAVRDRPAAGPSTGTWSNSPVAGARCVVVARPGQSLAPARTGGGARARGPARGRTRTHLRRHDESPALARAPEDRLHNVDELLLVLERPVDFVVVPGAEVDHDVLRGPPGVRQPPPCRPSAARPARGAATRTLFLKKNMTVHGSYSSSAGPRARAGRGGSARPPRGRRAAGAPARGRTHTSS